MPKGSKTCKSCGTITGPRAFQCPNCQTPFVIKGILSDLKSPQFRPSKAVEEDMLKVTDFMEKVDYTNDPVNIRCFDGNAKVWETPDGKYRIRYAETFMGIQVGHERPYTLLAKNSNPRSTIDWDFLHRFKTMHRALRGLRRLLNGEPLINKKDDEKKRRSKKVKDFTKRLAKLET